MRTLPLAARTTFAAAWSKYRSHALPLLALLAGWVGVWVVTEVLVIASRSGPGRPIWSLLHLGYFWATAYWEAAILARALESFGGGPGWKQVFRDHRCVFRLLLVKLLLVPAILVGVALLMVPGVYLTARYGLSVFYIVDQGLGLRSALGSSERVGRRRRLQLMKIFLWLFLFNVLGAALLGLGLLVTVPMTALAGAHVYRAVSSNSS